MSNGEFVDTYSDDLLYIGIARKVLLNHPLYPHPKEICTASFCRLFAVFMIGSIEAMLKNWKDKAKANGIRDVYHNLSRYFNFKKKVNNREKVQALYNAFQSVGVKVDQRIVLDQYLAIKYLRNVIVHARWSNNEKEQLDKCSFPTDTRKLTGEHLNIMQSVHENMALYIGLAGIFGRRLKPSDDVIKIKQQTEDKDDLGLVHKSDLPKIFWVNLEKIDRQIEKDMEQTILQSSKYQDIYETLLEEKLNKLQTDQMSDKEARQLYFLACRIAGVDGFELLVRNKPYANEAVVFWNEWWNLKFGAEGITVQDMQKALSVLVSLHERSIYPRNENGQVAPFPWTQIPDEKLPQAISSVLKDYHPVKVEDIVSALKLGQKVHDIWRNITPVSLFIIRAPIVDPGNTEAYLGQGEKALIPAELSFYWYSYVEYLEPPDMEKWDFYRQMAEVFRSRVSR